MPTLFWDASGLAKRYAPEVGTLTVAALFAHIPSFQMVTTLWGYTETYALLLRKRNGGIVRPASFLIATSTLRNDLFHQPDFRLLTVTDVDIIGSITHIQKHNLNSTDAALLAMLLRYSQVTGETSILIAADGRFCRAAQLEGLVSLNPELTSPADIPAVLASV